jgi:DNA repair exonuclease SbcCD ATPase subunit
MNNEVIFWTQIASIVTFLFTVFGLYRLLVDQKDATIQLLKETVSTLKDQLAEARSSTPDVLAQSLSGRVKLLESELERLSQDKDANQELVHKKEEELRTARQKAEKLTKQVSLARELLNDFLCPHCGAPLSVREYHSESVEYQGRELDVDHDYTEYECGYAVLDGKQYRPCNANHMRNASAITA